MGTKLKTAKVKFIQTIKENIAFKFKKRLEFEGRILIKKEKRRAKRKLAKGPAKATLAESFLGFLKLEGSIGTGFAQPKTIPSFVGERNLSNNKNPGKIIEPKRSKCFKGFKLNLPETSAVRSPKIFAISPWEISCKMTEKRKMKMIKIVSKSMLKKNQNYTIITL